MRGQLATAQRSYSTGTPWAYLRKMAVDLIPVKVSVVGVAIRVVHPDRLVTRVAEDSHAVRHDARLVECRLPVDQHAVPVVQMPPHLCVANAAVQIMRTWMSEGETVRWDIDGRVVCARRRFFPLRSAYTVVLGGEVCKRSLCAHRSYGQNRFN